MSKLYRYMGFEQFVDMVLHRALTFVSPVVWDDPYEFYPWDNYNQYLLEEEALAEGMDCDYGKDDLVKAGRNRFLAQCWTQSSESDALWKIFTNGGYSVKIKVDFEKILLLENVNVLKVRYDDKLFKNPSKLAEKFECDEEFMALKRTFFKHEEEVRLFFVDESITEHQYVKGEKGFENSKVITPKRVSYDHIDNFIEEVVVDPKAQDWFVETVKLFCEQNNMDVRVSKSGFYKR